MASEIFKEDIQLKIPLTKHEDCEQICKLQHTSKPRIENRYVQNDVEVLKFRCRKENCRQFIGEVIAGVRGDTLDQVMVNADKTAALVRKVAGCAASPIVNAKDLC